jgi:hypothetical protein
MNCGLKLSIAVAFEVLSNIADERVGLWISINPYSILVQNLKSRNSILKNESEPWSQISALLLTSSSSEDLKSACTAAQRTWGN